MLCSYEEGSLQSNLPWKNADKRKNNSITGAMFSFFIAVPKSLMRNSLRLEGCLLAHGTRVHREGEASLCVRHMAVSTDTQNGLHTSQQSRKQRERAGSRPGCKPQGLLPSDPFPPPKKSHSLPNRMPPARD